MIFYTLYGVIWIKFTLYDYPLSSIAIALFLSLCKRYFSLRLSRSLFNIVSMFNRIEHVEIFEQIIW